MISIQIRNGEINHMKDDRKKIKVIDREGQKILVIPSSCNLENVFQNSYIPGIMKDILKKVLWQYRVEYTVERAVMSPNLVPTWIATLLAWDVEVAYPEQEKTSSLEEYLHRTGFHPDKINALLVPVDVPGRVWGVNQVSRTSSDKPIVFAATVIDLNGGIINKANIALTGVWHEHVRLAEAAKDIQGKPLTTALILEVSERVKKEVTPTEDYLGSVDYRKEMARLLTSRSLQTCLAEGA